VRLWDNPLPEARPILAKIELRIPFQRSIRFLPEMDYPRASRSFPRIAGSGNEIATHNLISIIYIYYFAERYIQMILFISAMLWESPAMAYSNLITFSKRNPLRRSYTVCMQYLVAFCHLQSQQIEKVNFRMHYI
jgi:hypothetical protein